MKNTLGKWIESSSYSRIELSKLFGVSAQTVATWCGKNGIGKKYAEKVSAFTGIPVGELIVEKKPWRCKSTNTNLKWGGCWVE